MKTNLKTKKSNLKKHLIKQFGDEILKQTFKVYSYTTFKDLHKVYSWKFRDPIKYDSYFGTDDREPYFSINHLNIDEMIEIYSKRLQHKPIVSVNSDLICYDTFTDEMFEYQLN